jgi:hypothetical protein
MKNLSYEDAVKICRSQDKCARRRNWLDSDSDFICAGYCMLFDKFRVHDLHNGFIDPSEEDKKANDWEILKGDYIEDPEIKELYKRRGLTARAIMKDGNEINLLD